MKKITLFFATALLAISSMNAQEVIPQKKHSVATNKFGANWFISVGGEYNNHYSSQEAKDINFFNSKRGAVGGNISVGKWFTPGLGLRLKVQGIDYKQVNTEENVGSKKYWNSHVDVMFNLSNLFCGYNEKRVWNFIPYVGTGVARNMSDNHYGISYNAGLLNNFRLSKRVSVFLDVYANTIRAPFDGDKTNYDANQFYLRHWDKQLGASVGLTFNLGKANWDKTPDVEALMAMNQEQINALNASLKAQQDENDRLRELLAKKSEKVVKTEVVTEKVFASTPVSVFFNINRSNIASKKDLVNVKQIAEFVKANVAKVYVTGYADKKTGSSKYNQLLSEKRAQAVANILVNMGVNRDNIVVEGKGGVKDLTPVSYNRRVILEVK